MGLGDADGGHAGSGGGLDADVGVFEDEAVLGVDAEALSGEEEGVRCGLGVSVLAGTDESVEEVEDAKSLEGADDGFASASGDDGERDFTVLEVDLFQDLGDGL